MRPARSHDIAQAAAPRDGYRSLLKPLGQGLRRSCLPLRSPFSAASSAFDWATDVLGGWASGTVATPNGERVFNISRETLTRP